MIIPNIDGFSETDYPSPTSYFMSQAGATKFKTSMADLFNKNKWQWSASLNSDINSPEIMNRADGLPLNENPFIVPCPCVLTMLSASTLQGVNENWDFYIYKNGLPVESIIIANSDKGYITGLYIHIDAGDEIMLSVGSVVGTISRPGGTAWFREVTL